MSILIFALLVVVVVALLVWAVSMVPAPPPLTWVIPLLIVLIGALLIFSRLGVV